MAVLYIQEFKMEVLELLCKLLQYSQEKKMNAPVHDASKRSSFWIFFSKTAVTVNKYWAGWLWPFLDCINFLKKKSSVLHVIYRKLIQFLDFFFAI